MEDLEKELIEGYRKLKPESKNLVLSTVLTAVLAQEAIIREIQTNGGTYALPGAGAVMEAQT